MADITVTLTGTGAGIRAQAIEMFSIVPLASAPSEDFRPAYEKACAELDHVRKEWKAGIETQGGTSQELSRVRSKLGEVDAERERTAAKLLDANKTIVELRSELASECANCQRALTQRDELAERIKALEAPKERKPRTPKEPDPVPSLEARESSGALTGEPHNLSHAEHSAELAHIESLDEHTPKEPKAAWITRAEMEAMEAKAALDTLPF